MLEQFTRRIEAMAFVLALSGCGSVDGNGPQGVGRNEHAAAALTGRAVEVGRERSPFCTIAGTAATDALVGTPRSDVICGGAGNDRVIGGRGDDLLLGGPGNDLLHAGPGADELSGAAGSDWLRGGRGNDRLRGGDGPDRLADGAGRDYLKGNDGRDRLRTRDRRPYDIVAGGADVDLCIADAGDWRSGCRHPIVGSPHRRVPVLMYHMIGDPPPGAPFGQLWVSVSTFAAQMRFLDRHQYHVVNLQDVYDYWHGASLPSKSVVVSFDDGFNSHYRRARPILARHGWSGTLNLALSHLGADLDGNEIRALISANRESTPTPSRTPGCRD